MPGAQYCGSGSGEGSGPGELSTTYSGVNLTTQQRHAQTQHKPNAFQMALREVVSDKQGKNKICDACKRTPNVDADVEGGGADVVSTAVVDAVVVDGAVVGCSAPKQLAFEL